MASLLKHERLAIFLERLRNAPPPVDQLSAMVLIETTLNRVEDEFTDIPYRPQSFVSDGRLYPPQDDARREIQGRPDVWAFRNRAHRTYIGDNGAITITALDGSIVLAKPGADGAVLEVKW